MPVNQPLPAHWLTVEFDYTFIFFLLGLALLISLPALLVGVAFGKKAALIVATSSFVVGVPVVLLGLYLVLPVQRNLVVDAQPPEAVGPTTEMPSHGAPRAVVDGPILEPLPDPAVQEFAARLAERKVVSDPAARPTWIDQAPGLDHAVYRLPVKSGLYSTPEECRQALAIAVTKAVAQYGKTYLADIDVGDVLHRMPTDLGEKLIEQPLYAETVQASVGPMQQLHGLLEFSDDARGQLREAWRQAAIPRRLRLALSGFGAALGVVCVLLVALRFDLARGGKHRGRLRWATGLMILLVVGSAWGLCLL